MTNYFLGIDIGTTAIKGVLIDENANVAGSARYEQHQSFPKPGWAEQDPEELYQTFMSVIRDILANIQDKVQIKCIGLDHQGETCLVWDTKTGEIVYPAITWQDRRMAKETDAYSETKRKRVLDTCGLMPDSYYSAWKLHWILSNIPNGFERATGGELLGGTLNTWFIWRLTGKKSFVTDHGSASITMLFNPMKGDWDDDLLSDVNIPRQMLPQIINSDAVQGITDPKEFFGLEIPITASVPDCSAAIATASAAKEGGFVCTYGTGSFMHLVTGDRYIHPSNGLTSTCCMTLKTGKLYQLNGICYTAGSAIKWLGSSGLDLFDDERKTAEIAQSVLDTDGVYFAPALSGLATPFWDQSARGAFFGLTPRTKRAHLVRAVLESCALQVALCKEEMKDICSVPIESIQVQGGMTSNSFLMQLQANYLGIPVILPSITEPCFGAAMLASTHFGFSLESFEKFNKTKKIFEPNMDNQKRLDAIGNWKEAVLRTCQWNLN